MLKRACAPWPFLTSFMSSREIALSIARQIVRGPKRKFTSLYRDAVTELYMSTPTSSTGITVPVELPTSPKPTGATANAGTGINGGLGAAHNSEVRPITVKPVDHRAIEGTNTGDWRSKSSDVALPANPGPRQGMTQAPLSSRTPAPAAPASFLGAEGTDQN
jgi:hypothetical protein